MLFVQKVRAFKVSDKFVKSMKAKLNSIGFPASEVLNGNLSFESISEKIGAKSFEVKNGLVEFYLKDLESKKGYKDSSKLTLKWKVNSSKQGLIYLIIL